MARLPWWRIALLLVAAVALAWWLKHRTEQAPYGSEVHVATVVVAPTEGPAGTYRLTLGERAFDVRWTAEGESVEQKARREATVDEGFRALGRAARAFRHAHMGFERAEILVAAEHRGVVPFDLTARVLNTLIAAGYEEVEFRANQPPAR